MAKKFFLSLCFLGFAQFGFAQVIWENPPITLPSNVQEWLNLEVKVNPGSSSSRTGQPIRLEHIDVPIELLSENVGLDLRKEILESLVFEKNRKKYVRWIFNPEDTQYKDEFLKSVESATGIAPEVQSRFVGYLTASRSVVVQDPINQAIFSLKASTNKTGGNWNNKKMTAKAALISRAFSDFIARNKKQDNLKTFVALTEPLAFISEATDQSFTIRDYPIFKNKTLRAVPFFSALDATYGKEFAKNHSSEDPTSYWRKHLTEPWGRAMAEALSHYGFYPNSAHSQDFLVELDSRGEPTGRIYVRDIMDSDGEQLILEARNANEVLNIYKTTEKISAWSGKIYMKAIPFNGQEPPPWLNETTFMQGFISSFNDLYEKITGVKNMPEPSDISWVIIEKSVESDSDFKNWVESLRRKTRHLSCKTLFAM